MYYCICVYAVIHLKFVTCRFFKSDVEMLISKWIEPVYTTSLIIPQDDKPIIVVENEFDTKISSFQKIICILLQQKICFKRK